MLKQYYLRIEVMAVYLSPSTTAAMCHKTSQKLITVLYVVCYLTCKSQVYSL